MVVSVLVENQVLRAVASQAEERFVELSRQTRAQPATLFFAVYRLPSEILVPELGVTYVNFVSVEVYRSEQAFEAHRNAPVGALDEWRTWRRGQRDGFRGPVPYTLFPNGFRQVSVDLSSIATNDVVARDYLARFTPTNKYDRDWTPFWQVDQNFGLWRGKTLVGPACLSLGAPVPTPECSLDRRRAEGPMAASVVAPLDPSVKEVPSKRTLQSAKVALKVAAETEALQPTFAFAAAGAKPTRVGVGGYANVAQSAAARTKEDNEGRNGFTIPADGGARRHAAGLDDVEYKPMQDFVLGRRAWGGLDLEGKETRSCRVLYRCIAGKIGGQAFCD